MMIYDDNGEVKEAGSRYPPADEGGKIAMKEEGEWEACVNERATT